MEILELLTDPTAKPDRHTPRRYLPLSSLPPGLLCLPLFLPLSFCSLSSVPPTPISSSLLTPVRDLLDGLCVPPMEYHLMWGFLFLRVCWTFNMSLGEGERVLGTRMSCFGLGFLWAEQQLRVL